MEFIKKMRLRENIEIGIKTIIGILAAFLAIILMEGMIYGINLNALKTKSDRAFIQSDVTVAYCIKEAEDKYFVIYYNEDRLENDGSSNWSAQANEYKTKAECDNLLVKKVVYRAPTAFELTITPVHYAVMAVFVLAVCGYFVYRFIALNKTYNKIEDKYKKTGEIEITNM